MLATKHGKQTSGRTATGGGLGTDGHGRGGRHRRAGYLHRRIARTRPPLETAGAKARLGMDATGCRIGLATEGSFVAHPDAWGLTVHTEQLVLVDDTHPDPDGRPLVVVERATTLDTNAQRHTVTTDDQLDQALHAIGFPHAGVILRGTGTGGTDQLIVKGVCDRHQLAAALDRLGHGPGTEIVVEADLRAHHNPRRREVIVQAAWGLAQRLTTTCPACGLPGFGHLHTEPGLPCTDCGTPTTETAAAVHGCAPAAPTASTDRSSGPPHHRTTVRTATPDQRRPTSCASAVRHTRPATAERRQRKTTSANLGAWSIPRIGPS